MKEKKTKILKRENLINCKKLKKIDNGITLIALVITIIILLILAGVSIAMLTGENGILTQALNAKNRTDEADDIEKVKLSVSEAQIGDNGYQELNSNNLQEAVNNQFQGRNVVVLNNGDGTFTVSILDTLKDYIITENDVEEGIDWNKAMANAKAPESQDEERNEGVIGIGTDGKPVDMDLWEYLLLEDATYVLSDGIGYAYRGNVDSNGGITGKIPQYISIDNGKNYRPVTSLYQCMANHTNLKIAPEIPTTVNNIRDMFYGCTGLVEMSNIPNGVTEMWGAFNGCTSLITIPNFPTKLNSMPYAFENCTSLEKVPIISDGVTNMCGTFRYCTNLKQILNLPSELNDMSYTFKKCTSLEKVPIIPEKVTNMLETFYGCTNLTTVEIIPQSVRNLIYTFVNCAKLSGEMEINADITDGSKTSSVFKRSNYGKW